MIDDSLRRNVRHAACPVVCGARFRVRNERIGVRGLWSAIIGSADNVQNLRITVCKRTGPQSAHHVTCMSCECHVIVTYFSLDAFVIVCVPALKARDFRDIIVSEYR